MQRLHHDMLFLPESSAPVDSAEWRLAAAHRVQLAQLRETHAKDGHPVRMTLTSRADAFQSSRQLAEARSLASQLRREREAAFDAQTGTPSVCICAVAAVPLTPRTARSCARAIHAAAHRALPAARDAGFTSTL